MTTIVWFARDLRIHDHAPLFEALATSKSVLPLYIQYEDPKWPLGKGQKWWLERSLKNLAHSLDTLGLNLAYAEGDPLTIIKKLGREFNVKSLYFHRRYEPFWRQKQQEIEDALLKEGFDVQSFSGHLLVEPDEIKPYQVFTPYWKHFISRDISSKLIPKPNKGTSPNKKSELFQTEIQFENGWKPGEEGAQVRFSDFLKNILSKYDQDRDFPAVDGTSFLSPHLAFGEISPRTIWSKIPNKQDPFLRQIVWREFAYQLLWNHPETPTQPLKKEYNSFPWSDDEDLFTRWKEGRTGYPIVDAGMRQLAETGWMHNRVRLIVGSFLVKDLLIPWQKGAAWFWENLVDADLANNTFGWQWVSGCGADAAPYFRVFNPTLQQKRFDPKGIYCNEWDPADELPIVDHSKAKDKALLAWKKIRK